MPRFSANLSMLYPDLPFLDRFAAAAADGFKAVEYVGAYDQEPSALKALLDQHGLAQALFNLPAGNWAAGERGIACHPDRIAEFRQGIDKAIEYAKATRCAQVNCLAGIAADGYDRSALELVLIDNLRYAAPRFADAGIKLLLEPINTRDIPGFLINSTDDYERIASAVKHDNLYLQYDFYHMQIVQGDLIPTFLRLQSRIAHVQIADNPGRHEPGSGEINYPNIFKLLDEAGYTGWV
ncbi:MAG: hydroxypyruvate isomerase family protein, partial [Hyphomicrobiales bacterium]